MNRHTIILAEDHPSVAEQLHKLLSAAFDVVDVVGHGEALVKTTLRLKPDVVVTDISMPGMDGIRAAQELMQQMPSLGIVFVTVHDDPALARKALAVGRGYVLKTSAGEELIDAVFAVLDSRHFASASLGPIELLLDGDARPASSGGA
jgi:DNA-binding NarL/FixJ family response regulator